MNEITRIHLAKISYEIELPAKKALEQYFTSLQSLNVDSEMSSDIEIRMTEILAARGITKDGVITTADVEALRRQLGEPQDFIVDDDAPVSPQQAGAVGHKLFRSSDHALVGGVLGGIADYWGINPLWTRLIFIVLMFASFGLAIILYIILWIAVPQVRTVADKLQLRGRPVTVGSMRELAEREGPIDQTRDARVRRVMTVLLGIGFSVAALGALAATAIGAAGTIMRSQQMQYHTYLMQHMQLTYWLIGLAVASGLLLSVLCGLGAYASFAQKLTRKLVIYSAAVVVLGIATSGSLVALGMYVSEQNQAQISRQTHYTKLAIEGDLATAKSLAIVSSGNYSVHYYVSDQPAGATILRWTGGSTKQSLPQLTVKDGVATLVIASDVNDSAYVQPQVTITGPALSKITYEKGNVALDYNATVQDTLQVDVEQSGSVQLTGQINAVTATVGAEASLDAGHAAIQTLTATTGNDSQLLAGVVKQLQLTTREVCAADNKTGITIADVVSPTMTFNGTLMPVASAASSCTNLVINGTRDHQF